MIMAVRGRGFCRKIPISLATIKQAWRDSTSMADLPLLKGHIDGIDQDVHQGLDAGDLYPTERGMLDVGTVAVASE